MAGGGLRSTRAIVSGVGVSVGVDVCVESTTDVASLTPSFPSAGIRVSVGVGTSTGATSAGVGVCVGDTSLVGVAVAVARGDCCWPTAAVDGVAVDVICLGVGVVMITTVGVSVGVTVGVALGVAVADGIGVTVGVAVGASGRGVKVAVGGTAVYVGVAVAALVVVGVCVGRGVAVWVGVACPAVPTSSQQSSVVTSIAIPPGSERVTLPKAKLAKPWVTPRTVARANWPEPLLAVDGASWVSTS